MLSELDDAQAGKLFKAIAAHHLGHEIELDQLTKIIFAPFKNQFERDLTKWNEEVLEKSQSGKIGNIKRWRPDLYQKVIDNQLSIEEAIQQMADRTPIDTDRAQSDTIGADRGGSRKSLVSDSVNDSDNVNKKEDIETDNSVLVRDIVRVLNQATQSDFRPSSKSTSRLISARINDGYTFDEFNSVILHKTAQWKNDPKMKIYLRPETLFSTKFESYLQEAKKNISDDPETKYQILKSRGFKNISKEEIIWVFNYQHRTPSSYSDYPKDELIGERGEYYTQEEIERLFA